MFEIALLGVLVLAVVSYRGRVYRRALFWRAAIAVVLFGSLEGVALAQGVSRVAVMTAKDASDEFSEAIKGVGWNAEAYGDSAQEWDRLAKKLGDYDVVLAYPGMSNVSAGTGKALISFMEAGGAVVTTGVNADSSVAWLKALDAKYEVQVKSPENKAKSPPVSELPPDSRSTLLSFPDWVVYPADPVGRHFAFTGKNVSEWEPAARIYNQPCVILKRFGKGSLVLSTPRYRDAAFLGNISKMVELQRDGIAFRQISHNYEDTKNLVPGRGETSLRFLNTSSGPLSMKAVMEVTAKNMTRAPWGLRAEKVGNREFTISITSMLDIEGPFDARITLINQETGKRTPLLTFSETFPEFLEVVPPSYRGMISAARRDPSVHFAVALNPVAENVAGTKIEVSVSDPAGKVLATQEVVATGPGNIPVSLPLAADAPAGTYTLTAKAMRKGMFPISASAPFKIVPVRPGQVFIDQDSVILDEGKPFFPIGLYHAHLFQFDEWKDLGINFLQLWSWDWHDQYKVIPQARAAGIRVVYEDRFWGNILKEHRKPWLKQFSFETDAEFRAKIEKIRDDPSQFVSMWYLSDEAVSSMTPHVMRARDFLYGLDEDHPTFNLSTGNTEIGKAGDVLAIDRYPVYFGSRIPLTNVGEFMEAARRGVDYRKPVIAVIQSFGEKTAHTETPQEVRTMSYVALTRGIQGIMWYCWKETGDWKGQNSHGAQGAGWHPETAAMLKVLIAEIKVFAPALLEPNSRTMKSADGCVQAILAGSEKTGRFLVYVNSEYDPADVTLAVPELQGATLEPLFDGPAGAVVDGKLALKLPPLATGVYRVK